MAEFPTTVSNLKNDYDEDDEIASGIPNAQAVEINAIATKVGADSSAVTTTHDYKLSGVTGTDKAVSKTGTETLTNKTLTSPIITAPTLKGTLDGWILANETWTYASATTITVPSGAASKYSVGDKIKLTQTTVKYFYITGVADELLTITGGTSYTLVDAAITLNYYSKVTSPVGFPQWFAYTSTLSGWSGTPTQGCSFTINGNTAIVHISIAGTSDNATTTFTLPTASESSVGQAGMTAVADNGAAQSYPGRVDITAGSNVATATKTLTSAAFTAGNAKNIYGKIIYQINI